MKPCKYQRMVRGSGIIQPGDIDTQTKFADLTAGITLNGKTLLDVGCNCGEMCRLAAEKGAKPTGIDIHRDYVHQARQLHPGLRFSVRSAETVAGKYDIVVASAVFHYIGDARAFFARMAQVVREVLLMDVWLIPAEGAVLTLSSRGQFVPNAAAFRAMAKPWFDNLENKGRTLSPDDSQRWVYHLREPKPIPPKAVLVYGPGGSGKTTYAKELLDHAVLELDRIFINWYRAKRLSCFLSVASFVDALYARNDPDEIATYMQFHRNYLLHWLGRRAGFDVVIEGYDMIHGAYRRMVVDVLHDAGWSNVSQIDLHG